MLDLISCFHVTFHGFDHLTLPIPYKGTLRGDLILVADQFGCLLTTYVTSNDQAGFAH